MSKPHSTPTTGPTRPIRHVLSDESLARIHTAIVDAGSTGDLVLGAMDALYGALTSNEKQPNQQIDHAVISPDDYALPASQWHAITSAVIRRAEQWGTQIEVGIDLIFMLMPGQYLDPNVPEPTFAIQDYRPAHLAVTFDRDAVDVIAACTGYLKQLSDAYGADSTVSQQASYSWLQALTAVIVMNTGATTVVSKDGPLNLLVRAGSGLVYGVVFHAAIRRCTVAGCGAYLQDDGSAVLPPDGSTAPEHQHLPSYPFDKPRPGVWALHS